MGILTKFKCNVPCVILRNLYFMLLQPYLEYCNIVWATGKSVVEQAACDSEQSTYLHRGIHMHRLSLVNRTFKQALVLISYKLHAL